MLFLNFVEVNLKKTICFNQIEIVPYDQVKNLFLHRQSY